MILTKNISLKISAKSDPSKEGKFQKISMRYLTWLMLHKNQNSENDATLNIRGVALRHGSQFKTVLTWEGCRIVLATNMDL